jgi:HEAT repeat protein
MRQEPRHLSVTFSTYCRRCGVAAPELGDCGYVGLPLLRPRAKRSLLAFGTIYQGLAGMGMVTAELAAFHAFLQAHDEHPITQSADGTEEDFDDDASETPKRLKVFRFKLARQVEGQHELACEECGATFRSSSSERFAAFKEFRPSAEALRLFAAKFLKAHDENFYHVAGFPFDDRDELARFLAKHGRHGLVARLVPTDRHPRVGKATRTPPAAPWTPPVSLPEEHEGYLGKVTPGTLLLLYGLHHGDAQRRARACSDVAACEERAALGYLVPRLDDHEVAVRVAAVAAIAALGDPRGLRPLGRALLQGPDAVRSSVRRALEALGVAEDEALAQARALRGPYPVPENKAKPTTPAAIEAALRDPRSLGSYEALQTVVRRRSQPWASDLCLVVAANPGGYVRSSAAPGLAGRRDPPADAALLALLSDYHASPIEAAVKVAARRKLPGAGVLLSRALAFGDPLVSEAAADALEGTPEPAAAGALLEALRHRMPQVSAAAARALGALRNEAHVPALSSLFSHQSQRVREAGARALGAVGGKDAVDALVAQLHHHDADERRYAVWGLGALPAKQGLHALVACLRDRNTYVRGDAAHALARFVDSRADRALLAAARRGDLTVCDHVWRTLIALGEPATEKVLVAILRYGHSPDEAFRAYLESGNPRLAEAAARAWGQRRPPKGRGAVRWGERRV